MIREMINMIRETINIPSIHNLMNNYDLMRNLIISNPHIWEIIERNRNVVDILNDHGTLRQAGFGCSKESRNHDGGHEKY